MNGEKTLLVRSSTNSINKDPIVIVSYDQTEASLSIPDARKKGVDLIRAVTISETEASLIKVLVPKKKGFGAREKKEESMLCGFIELIRTARPKNLDPKINSIFGANTKKGLIDYEFLDKVICLELDEALDHAGNLIACAESAIWDSEVRKKFDELNLSQLEATQFLIEMKRNRMVNSLKESFRL